MTKPPLEVRERRVAALKREVGKAGGPAKFTKAHPDVDTTYVSQLIHGHRAFGERAARNMEHQCGWPPGYLDRATISVNRRRSEVDPLTEAQVGLLRLWGRLTPQQQAHMLELIQNEAAHNIEITQHFAGMTFGNSVPDERVAKALPKVPGKGKKP